MPPGLIALISLIAVHLFANRAHVLGWVWHRRFLSLASGLSFAYVFVDLLPALQKGEAVLKRTFDPLIPYLDKHTYLIALLGILFYYGIQPKKSSLKPHWLSLSGYCLFNFFIGASLADSSNPEIQPLALFTLAIGMHYFVRDHLSGASKNRQVLSVLILALASGYIISSTMKIPDPVTSIAISFIAGGILLNIFHNELPKTQKSTYGWFVFGALAYTLLLLSVGDVNL